MDEIKEALAGIGGGGFAETAKQLLGALGYQSRRIPSGDGDTDNFLKRYPARNPGTKSEQDLRECAKSLRALFQITDAEIRHDGKPLFGEYEKGNNESFLFVAVELMDGDYARGHYASFTREINKRFNMPVVVLYLAGDRLTAAFVSRRPGITDETRDVLETVTLIKDIRLQNPHRAHLEILAGLSLKSCVDWMTEENKKEPKNFDRLMKAWLAKLDTEELNRNFYKKLQEWFEWAKDEAVFPATLPKDEHVVRLLTRLLFVWFVKEKGLVAEEWFNPAEMETMLHNFNKGGGDYYRAVLQNLFFATLNRPHTQKPQFSTQAKPGHRVTTLYRYRSLITDEERFLSLMGQTPFVNGGLFDCLDEEKRGGKRIDMFSDPDPDTHKYAREKAWANLRVPDKLFFDKTRGLIPLFAHYKFTVEENTPVEQEVALDPELLGKVFENLLNWIIKKQTGSYYTPRVIVDYMVDESLVAAIADKCAPPEERERISAQLRGLLDYGNNYENSKTRFDENEAESIVRAIAGTKVLDPAVGSGAFPMGILHKLTLALKRLDPRNALWEKIQKERAQEKAKRAFDEHKDKESRDEELLEINDTFDRYRDSDYGRKLYLIQNSIFGADIQPIACQIAKLRFFISLAIEQQTNNDRADNFGVKPLPNLETRFVAADTLIKMTSRGIIGDEAERLERELHKNHARAFLATTYSKKQECIKEDARLRGELQKELERVKMPAEEARKITQWNILDQNARADWFDTKYMFGVDDGFDIVIGNPPYVVLNSMGTDDHQREYANEMRNLYNYARGGKLNTYRLFAERAVDFLHNNAHLCFIVPSTILADKSAAGIRRMLRGRIPMIQVLEFPESKSVFENVTQAVAVFLAGKAENGGTFQLSVNCASSSLPPAQALEMKWADIQAFSGAGLSIPLISKENAYRLLVKIYHQKTVLQNIAYIKQGDINLTFEGPFISGVETPTVLVRGEHIARYHVNLSDTDSDRRWFNLKAMQRMANPRKMAGLLENYVHQRIACQQVCNMGLARRITAGIVPPETVIGNSANFLIPRPGWDIHAMLAILSSSLMNWRFKQTSTNNHLNIYELEMFPFPNALPPETAQALSSLAQQILADKAENPSANTSQCEQEIDNIVYKLYGLTDEEIALVEDSI